MSKLLREPSHVGSWLWYIDTPEMPSLISSLSIISKMTCVLGKHELLVPAQRPALRVPRRRAWLVGEGHWLIVAGQAPVPQANRSTHPKDLNSHQSCLVSRNPGNCAEWPRCWWS